MQARRAIMTVVVLSVLGVSALAYLGEKGELPPPLVPAYGFLASLVASASEAISPAPAISGDRADAGPASARKKQTAPLSSGQLGAPLVNGKFVTECGAPDGMKVVVKVTVKMGRATEAAATTDPQNGAVATCVEKATREMQWDISPRTQRATVTY